MIFRVTSIIEVSGIGVIRQSSYLIFIYPTSIVIQLSYSLLLSVKLVCNLKKHQIINMSAQKRSNSSENNQNPPKSSSRKPSSSEIDPFNLGDLKDIGKKALKNLIPKQSMVLIKKLVQKGAGTLKRQIMPNHKLLPSLTLKKIQDEIFDKIIPQSNSFQQMNKQLTHSLLFFHQNINGEAEQGAIQRLQTEKCYKKIPKQYFEHPFSCEILNKMLTRDNRKRIDMTDELSDFFDQVEFNVNQQVAYKMKIFMSFVSFLASIGNLADLSLMKINGTRRHNQMIRKIVVQRAERVNTLRARKEQIQQYLVILHKIKKLKTLQNLIISNVHSKGKSYVTETYQLYCLVHEQIKQYCCPKLICHFWDVTYYIERGYQQSFSKSLKSYLCEIIVLDEKKLQQIVRPNKTEYVTVSTLRQFDLASLGVEQSFQVQAEVQLVSKHNIERQIVSIFKQGLYKCTYSTDQICQEIKNNLKQCENMLYVQMKGQPTSVLGSNRCITNSEKKGILDKLLLSKYIKIVQLWSERMRKIVRRQASVLQKALRMTPELRRDFPEKQDIICSYLMQIIYITFAQIDQSISSLIIGRKLKQQETQSIRQLLLCIQQWKELLIDLKHYPCIWAQLIAHFIEGQNKENIEDNILEGMLSKFQASRRKIVQIMINGFNDTAIVQLPIKLQEDEWKTISIPSEFYTTLGEVVYGCTFTKQLQNAEHRLLSSSLLLQRNSSFVLNNSQQLKKQQKDVVGSGVALQFDLQVSQNFVTIQEESFKIINSTIVVVQFIHRYLQWVEQTGQSQTLESTVLCKIMEFIIMYNKNIQDLILKKQALKYGKIKSKSITGKHLVIAYSQLKFFNTLSRILFRRFPKFQQFMAIIKKQIDKNILCISDKFKQILELSIKESIQKLVVDPSKEIKWPVPSTQEIVLAITRSASYVRDILMSDKEMSQFVGIPWSKLYIEKVKSLYTRVYKFIMNSNGTRKSKDIDWTDNIYWKLRQLDYISQSLMELRSFLPGFEIILTELDIERKKLENPH